MYGKLSGKRGALYEQGIIIELKQNKPWFDEKSARFLDERKQAKIQWFQDPNQSNIDNLII